MAQVMARAKALVMARAKALVMAVNRRATNILAITGVKKKPIPARPWSKNMVVIVEVANAMSTT